MSEISPGYATFVDDLSGDDRSRVHQAMLKSVEGRYGSSFESVPMEMIYAIASA